MIIHSSLTPQAMLCTPRRSPAVPNHDGIRALFTASTYTPGEGTLKELRVLDVSSGSSVRLSQDDRIHDANWIPDDTNTVLYLRDEGRGLTHLMTLDADHPFEEPRHVASIPAPVKHMKLARLGGGSIAVSVCGLAGRNGTVLDQDTEVPMSTAMLFGSFPVKENTSPPPRRRTIWFSCLKKEDNDWRLIAPFHNALRESPLEAPAFLSEQEDTSPLDNYDLCFWGIVFVALNPENKTLARAQVSDVYYVPIESFTAIPQYKPRRVVNQPLDFEGYCSNPRFSPDGSVVGYIKSPFNSPIDTRIYLSHLGSYVAHDILSRRMETTSWELLPVGFEFSPRPGWIFFTADDCGRLALYDLKIGSDESPRLLLRNGTVLGYYSLSDWNGERLLVSTSSFVESSLYQVIDVSDERDMRIVSSTTRHGTKLGLSRARISEVYFEGAGDYCVHSWMLKPAGFNPAKKYPVVLMLHDGPTRAWRDEWLTTWNLATWAEQGYIVVAPNITGSLGFGPQFSTAVYDSWGGRPYADIVHCMEFLKDLSFVDLDHVVAAGSGYGAYLINWILGQPLASKFKAFVSNGGPFHLPTSMLTRDPLSSDCPFGGRTLPSAPSQQLDRWNPSQPDMVKKWNTPTLVIHNSLDGKYPVSDGLAVFRTLQEKGVPSRLLSFPDEGHCVLRPENSLEWHRVVFEWMGMFVKSETGEMSGQDGVGQS